MRKYLFGLIAKMLAFIGGVIILVPILTFLFALSYSGHIDTFFAVIILSGFTILGFSMIAVGGIVQRRFKEIEPFLADNGGPIHSGRVWKKESESGLFLTSCGLVVSLSHESEATSHVGYRIVPAKRATCKDCVQAEGKTILDASSHRRDF